jgi:hypothetical protein
MSLAQALPAFHGLTLTKIGLLGIPIVDTGYQIPLLVKEKARKAGDC